MGKPRARMGGKRAVTAEVEKNHTSRRGKKEKKPCQNKGVGQCLRDNVEASIKGAEGGERTTP